MSKVTIIVPVYNTYEYLKECIDSLVNQTYKDIHIIMIDDGATDGSGDICDNYVTQNYCKGTPFCEVIHKENGGLSSARNAGIEKALLDEECQWIMFVDSDDFVDVSLVKKAILRADETNADIVCFEMEKIFGNTVSKYISYSSERNFIGKEKFELLFGSTGVGDYVCNKMFRKSVFRDIRFPLNRAFEDMFISCYLFENAKSVATCKGTYFYRQLNNSISNSKKCIQNWIDLLDAGEKQYKWFCLYHDYFAENAFEKCISAYAKVSVIIHDRRRFLKDRTAVFQLLKWAKQNRNNIQENLFAKKEHKKICMNASNGFFFWLFAPFFDKLNIGDLKDKQN